MVESLLELPPSILLEILSRLPIKSLFACRSACKIFNNLTSSNPHFNSLFSLNTPQSLVIQFGKTEIPTRLLRLVDSEVDTACALGEKVKSTPMFQIPNFPARYPEGFFLFPRVENRFVLVNSCNGLLYFAERNMCGRSFICNPITNEYVTLLEFNERTNGGQQTEGLWFGFSPRQNEYKVLRIFSTLAGNPWDLAGNVWGFGFNREFRAQVHVVGSCLWREIEDKPLSEHLSWVTCFTYLNGAVYWLCGHPETSKFIVFFDFQEERFGEILPPHGFDQQNSSGKSIGVLRGHICVINNAQIFDIWSMEKCGGQEYWTKEFVVDSAPNWGMPLDGQFRPLQVLSNGEILMIWMERVIMCYDPKRKIFRFLELIGVLGKAVVFTPSLVPLKDALMVDDLAVPSTSSRNDRRLAFSD